MEIEPLTGDHAKTYRLMRKYIVDNFAGWIGPLAMQVHVASVMGPDTEAVQFSDNGVLMINFDILEKLPLEERFGEILHGWTHIFFDHHKRGKELQLITSDPFHAELWEYVTCAVTGGYVLTTDTMMDLRKDFPSLDIGLPDDLVRTAEKIYFHLYRPPEPEDQNDEGEGEGEGEGLPSQCKGDSCGGAVESRDNPTLRELGMEDQGVEDMRQETIDGMNSNGKPPGDTPGEMELLIDRSTKPPKYAWEQEFRGMITAAINYFTYGHADYSYLRHNPFFPDSELIMPRLAGETKPRVGVVVDTSGSVDADGLRAALSEIKGILGSAIVEGYSVDAGVTRLGPVQTLSDFRLVGGGGTDMTKGIIACAEDGIDLCIVLTDGETPWPAAPIEDKPDMKAFAGIIGRFSSNQAYGQQLKSQVPYWMKSTIISMDGH